MDHFIHVALVIGLLEADAVEKIVLYNEPCNRKDVDIEAVHLDPDPNALRALWRSHWVPIALFVAGDLSVEDRTLVDESRHRVTEPRIELPCAISVLLDHLLLFGLF